MGILNSVALGKSRNSAGNITFYNRIGVGCFRQKAGVSPNYKPTVAQQMQQRVFKFIKANLDASGVMALLKLTYDAKPKAGKSQTMYNMFYKSFTPHVVLQKPAIYELAEDNLVNPAIFLGTPASHSDIFSNGVLGALPVVSCSVDGVVVDAAVLDSLISKANSMLSAGDIPFTTKDCFVSIFGASKSADGGYEIVFPTKVTPTQGDGTYKFDVSSISGSVSPSAAAFIVLTLAKSSGSTIDMTKRMFSTDSVELAPSKAKKVTSTFSSGGGGGANPEGYFPLADLTAAGLSVEALSGVTFHTSDSQDITAAVVEAKDGTSAKLKLTYNGNCQNVELAPGAWTFTSADGTIVLNFTNSLSWDDII